MVDGLFGDDQALRDLRVPQAFRDQREYLELARGETGRVLARSGARPARYATYAAFAQSARDDCRSGTGAQLLQVLDHVACNSRVVAFGQCERRLVGAAELAPRIGSFRAPSGDR